MRSAFDFAPYRRSTIGFDRLFDLLENDGGLQSNDSYPPFDLIKLDDNHFRINLAVAGFNSDQITITAQQNQLLVSGKRGDDEGIDFVHRGIATRSFDRRFGLADHVTVQQADLRDGLLQIDLVREIPEAMKPRTIAIGGSDRPRESIEAKANEHA
jgi:molecular chaperone IbpA